MGHFPATGGLGKVPNPILYRRSPDKPIHSGPERFHPQTPKKDRPPRGPCPGPGRIHVVARAKTLSSTDVPNP